MPTPKKIRTRYAQHAWRRDSDGRVVKVVEPVGGVMPSTDPGPFHPVLSVVIPAHGRGDLAAAAAASVRRAVRWNCVEVLVVDDASPERLDVPGARVIRLEENVGFAGACNAGAAAAAGAFLLFLNSDAQVSPGCVEALLDHAHSGWDVVGPRLLYPDGRLQHGGFYWDAAARSHMPAPGKGGPGDAPGAVALAEVDAVSGACVLVRASTFRALGGFDRAYGRGYYEDVDMCLRAWVSGARVLYAGDAVATHWESQTFGDFHRTEATRAQLDRAHAVFVQRWLPGGLFDVWDARADEARLRGRVDVDVVVTAHGASDRLEECLAAVRRGDPYARDLPDASLDVRLLVVDDASPPGEAEAVAAAAARWGAELLRLDENVGYRRAAEAGIAATDSEWFVLLNSDTVPTRSWLRRMVRAAGTDPRIAVVNPMCNNAADLSAGIPRGRDLEGAARAASAASLGSPVDVAYPVGFCLMVRRRAYVALGGFDGVAFPEAYGEETDLCERAFQAGMRCVVEPSAYVYHEGKASHGDRAHAMEEAAVRAFKAKHGQVALSRLAALANVPVALRQALGRARPSDPRPSVTFFLPELSLCGGVLACYHLARRLSAHHGWRATVSTRNLADHPTMEHAGRLTPLWYQTLEQFSAAFATDPDAAREGFLVATAWYSAKPVADAVARCGPGMRAAYFVQDDESLFLITDGKGRGYDRATPESVRETYGMIPHLVANSPWVGEVVRQAGSAAEVIPVGVDHRLFRPRPKYERFTVLAMCRHTTPRRGYALLREVYRELRDRMPDARLLVYGQVPLPGDARYMEHVGQLPQNRLADVMGRSHVLVEPSIFQGFGLPALEAMASGCVPVSLDNRGIHTYGRDGRDCVITAPEGVTDAVVALREDPGRWADLARAGRATAEAHTWDLAAERWSAYLRARL